MKAIQVLFICSVVILFTGCERNVDFRINEQPPKLVVEATIENGQAPIVYLSKSLSFYSTVDPSIVANSFVHNAEVYISNGTQTHRMQEFSTPVGNGYYFYYYSWNPFDPSTAFAGELNKNYSLRIVSEGKEYHSVTRIPDTTRHIDSLYWKNAPPGNISDRRAVMIRATDRPGFGDYIRYFTKRNHEPFYPGLNSVYDDQILDGRTFEVQVERGVDRTIQHPEGYSFFFAGDTVTLKLCNIDKATFDFWRTMEFTYANAGNPFATPTRVLSNISGDALGYFGGYAAQYRTIIIPR